MSTTATTIMSAKTTKTGKLPAKPRVKRTRAPKPAEIAESSKTAEPAAKPANPDTPVASAKPPAKRTRAGKVCKTAEISKTAELSAELAAKLSDTAEHAAEPSNSDTPAAKPTDSAEPITKPSNSGTPAAKPSDSAEPTAKPSGPAEPAAKPIAKPAAKSSGSAKTRPIQYHETAAEALVMGGVTNTATAKKLASMDWIRPVLVKEDRGLNMARPVNVEAILGYSRGELAEAVCECCTDSKGPFVECVTVEGMFAGSCTNCHYNSQGKYCNFRPEIKPCERPAPIASSSAGTAEIADKPRRVAKRKRTSPKEKWRRLLMAVEGVTDAIEDIMEDMED